MRNEYKIFVGNHGVKRPLGRTRHRWEDSIIMQIGLEGVNSINLSQGTDRRRAPFDLWHGEVSSDSTKHGQVWLTERTLTSLLPSAGSLHVSTAVSNRHKPLCSSYWILTKRILQYNYQETHYSLVIVDFGLLGCDAMLYCRSIPHFGGTWSCRRYRRFGKTTYKPTWCHNPEPQSTSSHPWKPQPSNGFSCHCMSNTTHNKRRKEKRSQW
jgi:hypothetical protein